MTEPPQAPLRTPITTRAAIAERIEAHGAGQITNSALAQWAFDRFYAEELGNEAYEAGAEDLIAAVLDTVMFGDDPSSGVFCLPAALARRRYRESERLSLLRRSRRA
jgi:hypothetical protein